MAFKVANQSGSFESVSLKRKAGRTARRSENQAKEGEVEEENICIAVANEVSTRTIQMIKKKMNNNSCAFCMSYVKHHRKYSANRGVKEQINMVTSQLASTKSLLNQLASSKYDCLLQCNRPHWLWQEFLETFYTNCSLTPDPISPLNQ